MSETQEEVFLTELKALLEKHNARIEFSCSPDSDTYGIHEATIQVAVDESVVLKTGNWCLDASDIQIHP